MVLVVVDWVWKYWRADVTTFFINLAILEAVLLDFLLILLVGGVEQQSGNSQR